VCDCAGLQLEHQQLRSLNPAQDGALIYRADMQSTLHEVVLYGFLQPNAAGYMHVSQGVCVSTSDCGTNKDLQIISLLYASAYSVGSALLT
jgi:hypothetical protein